MDAGGEIVATMLGVVENGAIRKVKEIVGEDALGEFYGTMTDYLGFERGDGEYKVMGMAPFGDASKINFDHILWWDEKQKTYKSNHRYVWAARPERFRLDKVVA